MSAVDLLIQRLKRGLPRMEPRDERAFEAIADMLAPAMAAHDADVLEKRKALAAKLATVGERHEAECAEASKAVARATNELRALEARMPSARDALLHAMQHSYGVHSAESGERCDIERQLLESAPVVIINALRALEELNLDAYRPVLGNLIVKKNVWGEVIDDEQPNVFFPEEFHAAYAAQREAQRDLRASTLLPLSEAEAAEHVEGILRAFSAHLLRFEVGSLGVEQGGTVRFIPGAAQPELRQTSQELKSRERRAEIDHLSRDLPNVRAASGRVTRQTR